MKSELSSLSSLPSLEQQTLSETARKEAMQLGDDLMALIDRQEERQNNPTQAIDQEDRTANVLHDVVEEIEEDLEEINEDLEELFGRSPQSKLSQRQSDVLQQIDPDLQIDLGFGEDLVAKLESDPAKAKTAFENISALLKDDTQDSEKKQSAIGAICNETHDSTLQIFANISKEIIALKDGGKISAEEERQAIQKLTEQFAFLGDGKERNAAESVELALINAEEFSEDGVILGAVDKGFLDTLNSIKEKNQLEYDPSELEEEDYKDDFEEEDEVEQDKIEQDEVEQDEVEQDDPEEESEEEKALKKKKAQALQSSDTKEPEGPEKDQKKKRGISYKDAEEMAKVAAKPALRLGIALALAFAVPGVGVVLAAGFLLATSSKEEEKQNEKKPEDRPLENEADKYLEGREKMREQIEKGGPDTEVKKVTHGVELEQQAALGEMASTLKTASSSLKRVDGPTQEQKKVVAQVPSQFDEKTLKDARIAVSGLDPNNLESSSSHANAPVTSVKKTGPITL